MQMTLGFVMFTAALVSAAPSIRRDDGVNCGSSHYSLQAIEEASKTACYYVKRDEQVPGFTFPGKFDNIEKFDFKGAPGPFYTFPILSSGNVYVGGNPGPDRVVINGDCLQVGQITHTGGVNGGYAGCSGTGHF